MGIEERIKEFKAYLMRRSPFLAFSLDELKVAYIDQDDPRYITVKGDEIRVYRNAEKLSDPEFAYATLRAVVHGIFYHGLRANRLMRELGLSKGPQAAKDVVKDVARLSADIVAWRMMPQRIKSLFGFDEMILKDLIGEDWKILSMEEIFWRLVQVVPAKPMVLDLLKAKAGENVIEGLGEGSERDSGDAVDSEAIAKAEKKLVDVVMRTLNFSQIGAGTEESEEIRKLLEEFLKKKPLPWYKILRRYLQIHFAKQFKVTYKVPSRKHKDLPGLEMYGKPRTFVAVDVSGSIDDKDYSRFCREVLAIAKAMGEVRFICWDVKAKDYGSVRTRRDMLIRRDEVTGYGGTKITSLKPILEEERVGPTDLLIVLTDGAWYEGADEIRAFLGSLRCKKVLVTTNCVHEGFDKVIKVERDVP
ncbi:MAG: VWA-like domain-containing protein [Thermofilaceae archaeon]